MALLTMALLAMALLACYACGPSEQESDITKVMAMCAMASVAYVGMLHTVMPLAAAAATSTSCSPPGSPRRDQP